MGTVHDGISSRAAGVPRARSRCSSWRLRRWRATRTSTCRRRASTARSPCSTRVGSPYLDLTGSGIETVAHVARERADHADVLRVRRPGPDRAALGRGTSSHCEEPALAELAARLRRLRRAHGRSSPSSSTAIADSCGYGVPRMAAGRPARPRCSPGPTAKGDDGLARATGPSATPASIDGLPGF